MMDCYMKRRSAPIIIYDSFNRANGALGNADTGQAWLTNGLPTTVWCVGSNVAKRSSPSVDVTKVAYIDSGKSDVTVSANITISNYSYGAYMIARMSGTSYQNGIALYIDATGLIAILRTISGSTTILGSGTYSYSSGTSYSCVLTCKGNSFTASIDGVTKVSVTNDNALKTNTIVGMYLALVTDSGYDYFDNFSVRG